MDWKGNLEMRTLLVNDVFEFDGHSFRILYLEANSVYWIDIYKSSGLPEKKLFDDLIELLSVGELRKVKDPFHDIQSNSPAVDSVPFKKRNEFYSFIKNIVDNPGIFDRRVRGTLISDAVNRSGKGAPTIYRLLRRYWQRGQCINALMPDYRNSGAKGKTRNYNKKPGKKTRYGAHDGVIVDESIRIEFRSIIDKLLMRKNKFTVKYAYRRFVESYQAINGIDAQEPSFSQFTYFYYKEYSKSKRITKKASSIEYRKDIRPLHSTATKQTLGPGSRYEIDATIADIYLVDEVDPQKIIGRPTIYMVIDVFSRMVAGYYIGFDNPSYPVAMKALISSFSDKTDIIAKYYKGNDDVFWPCVGVPLTILADRGEFMSHQANYLIEGLGIHLESAPPYRGDAKGIVERYFGTLQSKFKPYCPGVVEGNKIKKHGEKDYRVEARLTISDFTEIIIQSILIHNLYKPLTKYDRAADIPEEVPSVPVHLWNWGIQNRTGRLRAVDIDRAKVLLLPRKKVTVSEEGVKLWGLTYTGTEIFESGWMHRTRGVKRPKGCLAGYDLGSTNHIYLFPDSSKNDYWICNLSDRSREFLGMTWNQVWERQAEQKRILSDVSRQYLDKELGLDLLVKEKLSRPKNRTTEKKSNANRLRRIKSNKSQARELERKNDSLKPKSSQENHADIISFDENKLYKRPKFIPELFQDEDLS